MCKLIKFKTAILTLTVLMLLTTTACSQNKNSKNTANGNDIPLTVIETYPLETQLNTPGLSKTHKMWENLFASAREKIQIGMFYMISKEQSRLENIIKIIKEKAKEGVKIEIVTDKTFYENYPEIPDKLDEMDNSSIKIIDLNSLTGGVMHAKYLIIDRTHFYLGSANFDWRSLEHICEIGIGGTDPDISSDLAEIFKIDYKIAGGKNPSSMDINFHNDSIPDYKKLHNSKIEPKSFDNQITATPPSITPEEITLTEEAIIKTINTAQEKLLIDMHQYSLTSSYSTGYYDHIDRALRRAANREVDIEFMVSDWALTEKQQIYLKSLQVIPQIEIRYIQIPKAKEGHIPFARVDHSKLMIADNKVAWTGSSNWQPGYFNQSRNVGFITNNKEKVNDFSRYFKTAWKSKYCHFLEIDKNYSPPRKQ
ncbi:MAG: phospholipase D-like domain-containing protein [Elusimicrobiota bacterium]